MEILFSYLPPAALVATLRAVEKHKRFAGDNSALSYTAELLRAKLTRTQLAGAEERLESVYRAHGWTWDVSRSRPLPFLAERKR